MSEQLTPYQIKNILRWHENAVKEQQRLELEHPELFSTSPEKMAKEFRTYVGYVSLIDVFYLLRISRVVGLAAIRKAKIPLFLTTTDSLSNAQMRKRDIPTLKEFTPWRDAETRKIKVSYEAAASNESDTRYQSDPADGLGRPHYIN